MPAEKLELGFDDNAAGNWFVLDSATRGLLNNATYVLSGAHFYDVTQYVKSINTSRGKNRDLDRFDAGHLTAVFDNTKRLFDPTYASSPFYGQIVPRRQIRYSVDNIVQFYGLVDDWDLSYSINQQSEAVVSAYDGFTALANQTLTAGTATSQLSGARINAVLNDPKVNWPAAARNIDAGNETLQADVIAGTQDVLQYINLIENTEPGLFFIDKSGNATWIQRQNLVPVSGVTTIADDGTGIPYIGVNVVYGSELLYNQVSLTRLNGATAVGNEYTSQSNYGIRNLTQTGLLHSTDSALANEAAYLTNLYKNPEFRFEKIDFALHDMSPSNRATLLNMEIGRICLIKFTPNRTPPTIGKYAQVIGMDHDTSVDGHHILSLKFQTTDVGMFILNDVTFGLIEYSVLGY